MGRSNFLEFLSRHKVTIALLLLVASIGGAQGLLDKLRVDNLLLDGNTVSSTDTNGNVTLDANGTGKISVNAPANFPDLTATTVPYLDANKDLVSSDVTPTELDYLDGVTDFIQTQLDGKQAIGDVKLFDGDTNYIELTAPAAMSADVTYEFPGTDGTNGALLQTSGAGVLSFVHTITGDKTFSDQVGIGVAFGTNALTVKNTVNSADGGIFLYDNQGNDYWRMNTFDSGYFNIIKDGLTFYPFTIDNTGKVGIGVSGASATLEVARGANQVQLMVKSHSTQTADLVEFYNTSAAESAKIEGDGDSFWARVFAGTGLAFSGASVGLELNSTTLAFLPSRMTEAQRDALTAINGMLIYNSDSDTFQGYQAGAWASIGGGGGGGGIDIEWVQDWYAPVESFLYNSQVYAFEDATFHLLYTELRVPDSYVAGDPISLKLQFFTSVTSGTVLFQTETTLIRNGTDASSSTTNQHTSTNSAITVNASTNVDTTATLDLTDGSGLINAVAVSPGDRLKIELTRATGTDTAAATAYLYKKGSEVTLQ